MRELLKIYSTDVETNQLQEIKEFKKGKIAEAELKIWMEENKDL